MPPRHIVPEITAYSSIPEVTPPERTFGRVMKKMLGKNATNEICAAPKVEIFSLAMSVDYGVKWDTEKCGRDAFQNFFDANGGTLDDVEVEIDETYDQGEASLRPMHNVVIRGNKQPYDYRDLLTTGGTTKRIGRGTAGGFGEGAKVLALVLLRDKNVQRIIHRSGDWQLEYYLAEIDERQTARKAQGLHAKVVTGLEFVEGSELLISCTERETAEQLVAAKELFYSSENPDFQNPTFENQQPDGSRIGMKLLGITDRFSGDELVQGHLYIAGQRRKYNPSGAREDWESVGGMSVWTSRDVASGDRDRGSLNKGQLETEILRPFGASFDESQVREFFAVTEPSYAALALLETDLGNLARAVAEQGEELGVKIAFGADYVARDAGVNYEVEAMLKAMGKLVCPNYFSKVGMIKATEFIRRLHEHANNEPTPEELAKINLLYEAVALLRDSYYGDEKLEPIDIALYSNLRENAPTHGTFNHGQVWIAKEHLRAQDLPGALSTYLHELNHRHGGDTSAKFSYALTDTLTYLLRVLLRDQVTAQEFQDLSDRWEEILRQEAEQEPHD